MATATLSSSPSVPQFLITSQEISRYAELTSLLTQLEKQKDTLRAELLELYEDGAQQEETGPYLLAFTDQKRRSVDWKSEALSLAAVLYGAEGVNAWKLKTEQAAPAQLITAIRVKPNPAFAAGVVKSGAVSEIAKKPVASVRPRISALTTARQ
jgi:hypothetical protein